MKKIIFIVICLLVCGLGVYKLTGVKKIPVLAQCIEVTHSSDKYGRITRYGYLKFPDGSVQRSSSGEYYEVGKWYHQAVWSDQKRAETGFCLIMGSLVTMVIGINIMGKDETKYII